MVRSWKGDGRCWSEGREALGVGQKGDDRCWSEGREALGVGQKLEGRR